MQADKKSEPYKNYDTDFLATPETGPSMIMPNQLTSTPPKRFLRLIIWIASIACLFVLIGGVLVHRKISTPVQMELYPVMIEIPKGSSLQAVTGLLYEKKAISSPLLFRMLMILSGGEHSIKTGEYTFNKPLTMTETISKILNGRYEYEPVRLTIREGENAHEIARAINAKFPRFLEHDVYNLIRDKEGRLFPETYIFAPFATTDEILKTIEGEFVKRIATFTVAIASSTKTEQEILTIASILEREVPQKADMKIVSGIIQNRLAKGMPLQMDSTLGFITGKASLQLVTEDLKIESPYNTYVNKGLPPGPIGNPGDVAIEAALNPDTNNYLFFLSDKNGSNHYAVTYTEHLKNRRLYLGK